MADCTERARAVEPSDAEMAELRDIWRRLPPEGRAEVYDLAVLAVDDLDDDDQDVVELLIDGFRRRWVTSPEFRAWRAAHPSCPTPELRAWLLARRDAAAGAAPNRSNGLSTS